MYYLDNVLYMKVNEVKNPKACVIITHGLAEHSIRYDDFVKVLNEKDIMTVQYDLQGHGRSGGKRGNINSFHEYLDDLHNLVVKTKELDPTLPIILFGHSMGGLIVHLYKIKYNDIYAIISSAAITQTPPKAKILKYIGFWYLKFINLSTLKLTKSESNNSSNKEYSLDPYILRKIKLNLVGQVFIKGMKYLERNIDKIDLPILYLHGTDDDSIPYEASENIYNKISSSDKTLKTYVNAKHDLLNDSNKERVVSDILRWLKERI